MKPNLSDLWEERWQNSWFDEKAEHQAIQERASIWIVYERLADGVVSKQELTGQEQRLVTAMKKSNPS